MSEGPYSYETGVKKTFHAADYAVFGCTLAVSASIGIFYAIKDRNKKTTEDYLLAGRSMHPIPVAMSLLSSFISAVTVLGIPAEAYVYGPMYWWTCVGFTFTIIGAAHIFIPVFYNLGITSVFEYVDIRFGRATRTISVIIYLIWMMFYMAIVLYAPSLALNAVTGLSLWGSVLAVSLVCIFYTTLGGMKAVLWTDTIQMTIVFAGMITLVIKGLNVVGGFNKAWEINDKYSRIYMFDTDSDIRKRYTLASTIVGGSFLWSTIFCINQAQVQRAISVRSMTRFKIAIWLNLPGLAGILTLAIMVGFVMFAFYSDCDPVKFGLITNPDQLVPLWTMDLLGDTHGLPGLLLSTVFSASLSTISSGLNALAAVLLEDFVKPMCCKGISNQRATLLSKGFVILGGLFCLALAFVVSKLDTMIVQIAFVSFGILGGPLLGLFSLGMLFPWANKWGGMVGLLTSLTFTIWIGLGAVVTRTIVAVKPPVSTAGCNYAVFNQTAPPPLDDTVTFEPNAINDYTEGLQSLYTVSFMYYTFIATVTCVIVGLIVSIITGVTDTTTLSPKLICPFFDVFFPFLPERWRKPLRFGVRHREEATPDFNNFEKRKEKVSSLFIDDEFSSREKKAANGVDNTGYTTPMYNSHL